jgi:hypothetical protein
MDQAPKAAIARILQHELAEAERAHLAASERFRQLRDEVQTGLPNSDGPRQIHQVSHEARTALDRYMKALRRSTDFLISGVIPDHPL